MDSSGFKVMYGGEEIPLLFLQPWHYMGVGGQRHTGRFTPGKTQYPLYRRLGWPQGRSGRVQENSPPPGFDPQTVHSIASRYTDWAILTHWVLCNYSFVSTNVLWELQWQCSIMGSRHTVHLVVYFCTSTANFCPPQHSTVNTGLCAPVLSVVAVRNSLSFYSNKQCHSIPCL